MNFSWAIDLDPKGANNQIKEAINKRYLPDDEDCTTLGVSSADNTMDQSLGVSDEEQMGVESDWINRELVALVPCLWGTAVSKGRKSFLSLLTQILFFCVRLFLDILWAKNKDWAVSGVLLVAKRISTECSEKGPWCLTAGIANVDTAVENDQSFVKFSVCNHAIVFWQIVLRLTLSLERKIHLGTSFLPRNQVIANDNMQTMKLVNRVEPCAGNAEFEVVKCCEIYRPMIECVLQKSLAERWGETLSAKSNG